MKYMIRQNLQRFDAVFDKLTSNEKKDLLRLLIKEIIYNQDPSKIKMTLRPLPELDLEVEGDKVSFDERQKWLPIIPELQKWLNSEDLKIFRVLCKEIRLQ